ELAAVYRDAGQLADAVRGIGERRPRCRTALGFPAALADQALECALSVSGRSDRAQALALRDDVGAYLRENQVNAAPDYADRLAAIARRLLAVSDGATAETALRKALDVWEKAAPTSVGRFEAQSLLGEALLRQGKCAEA